MLFKMNFIKSRLKITVLALHYTALFFTRFGSSGFCVAQGLFLLYFFALVSALRLRRNKFIFLDHHGIFQPHACPAAQHIASGPGDDQDARPGKFTPSSIVGLVITGKIPT